MPDQAGDHIGLFKTRQVGNALQFVGFCIRRQLRDQAGALLDTGKVQIPPYDRGRPQVSDTLKRHRYDWRIVFPGV